MTVERPHLTVRAFVKKDGKYLMIFAPWCERWTLPGGRVDGGETIEQAIERELQEELQLSTKSYKFVGFGQGIQRSIQSGKTHAKLHMLFYVETDQDLVFDEEEVGDVRWMTLEELKNADDMESGLDDFFRRFPEVLE